MLVINKFELNMLCISSLLIQFIISDDKKVSLSFNMDFDVYCNALEYG